VTPTVVVSEPAGELGVPFTTGILVGIGEDPRDHAASLLVIQIEDRARRRCRSVIDGEPPVASN
jgi:FO synthase subunit 1